MNDPTEIRQWARENGVAVSERGKLRADVIAEYEAAHPVTGQDDGDTAPVITLDLPVEGPVLESPAVVPDEPLRPRRQEIPPRAPRRSKLRDRLAAKPDQPKHKRVSLESLASWAWGLGGMALQQAPKSIPVGRLPWGVAVSPK